jgi:membrane protein implicated in regulation of membrane protease activity
MLLGLVEWWAALGGSEKIFWSISIVFSVLFFIQFILSLIGIEFSVNSDGAESTDGFHLDKDFALFSVRSIIAFFTFFGWTGVLILNKGIGAEWATLFGLLAGIAAMLLVAYLFWLFARLTQDGNSDIYQTLFHTAEVYIPIPGFRKGSGKIIIEINGAAREMEAITEGDPISTGTKVKVVEVMENNLLVVYPLETYDTGSHFSEPPKLS